MALPTNKPFSTKPPPLLCLVIAHCTSSTFVSPSRTFFSFLHLFSPTFNHYQPLDIIFLYSNFPSLGSFFSRIEALHSLPLDYTFRSPLAFFALYICLLHKILLIAYSANYHQTNQTPTLRRELFEFRIITIAKKRAFGPILLYSGPHFFL